MKKPKLNLSKQGLKDFFFRHTEKLIFGVTCCLIGLFAWYGFKTPSFDAITPKVMLDKSKQADTFINDASHWDKLDEHREADTNPAERIRNAKMVDASEFKISQVLGTAVLTRVLRRDPAILPPEDFEVRSIRAQVALRKDSKKPKSKPELKLAGLPTSGLAFPSDQRNESFIYRSDKNLSDSNQLVTLDVVSGMAKINYQKQLQNYIDNFQSQRGYDPNRDFPVYVAIEVQRKTADTEWQPITGKLYERQVRLAKPAKELVDDRYIIEGLTLPIPPMLGFDYRQFAMPDDIPMKEVLTDEEIKQKLDGNESADDETSSDNANDPFGDDKKKPATEEKEAEVEEEDVATRLIRFYDVDPKKAGETYFYRLRVWLMDPNDADLYKVAEEKKEGSDRPGGPGMGGDGAVGADGNQGGNSGGDKKKGRGGNNKATGAKPKPLSELTLSSEVRTRLNEKRLKSDAPSDLMTLTTKVKNKEGKEEDVNNFPIGDIDLKTIQKGLKYGIPTEWVEAEQAVTIGTGFETFVAGPIKPPSIIRNPSGGWFSTDEPQINVVANSFQNDLGIIVPATKEKAVRGSLLNFEAVTNLLHPLTWEIKDLFESEDTRKGIRTGRRFITNALVLDIMGGERQSFTSSNRETFFAPGAMLLMDRNGRVEIHGDIDDETGYRHANFVSDDNNLVREESSGRRGRDEEEDDSGRED